MSDLKTEARTILAASLQKRNHTATIATAILNLDIVGKNTKLYKDLKTLADQADYVSAYDIHEDFAQVDPIDTQLVTFAHFFPIDITKAAQKTPYQSGYVDAYKELLTKALHQLGAPEACSAQHVLRNRHIIDFNNTELSHKGFVKRLRFLARFEQKIERFEDVLNLRHAQMQAKSRLAYAINASTLDDYSLSYVAYLTARANRSSLFMLGGQSKAFDNISEGLKKLIPNDAAWEQIAYVHPTTEVFSRVSAEKLGQLVGVFHQEMVSSAERLSLLWDSLPMRMRDEMVMVAGVDSSRWNAYAGAYNTMRSAWISASLSSGLGFLFNSYLPGKAPRLMAADIVWWARNSGQKLHGDTVLFKELPRPWDVINGKTILTRNDILSIAAEHDVDDVLKSGWVGPRTDVETEEASVEPATLHGVAVGDPKLFAELKKNKIFSGKSSASPEKLSDEALTKISNRGSLPSKSGKTIPVVGTVETV